MDNEKSTEGVMTTSIIAWIGAKLINLLVIGVLVFVIKLAIDEFEDWVTDNQEIINKLYKSIKKSKIEVKLKDIYDKTTNAIDKIPDFTAKSEYNICKYEEKKLVMDLIDKIKKCRKSDEFIDVLKNYEFEQEIGIMITSKNIEKYFDKIARNERTGLIDTEKSAVNHNKIVDLILRFGPKVINKSIPENYKIIADEGEIINSMVKNNNDSYHENVNTHEIFISEIFEFKIKVDLYKEFELEKFIEDIRKRSNESLQYEESMESASIFIA